MISIDKNLEVKLGIFIMNKLSNELGKKPFEEINKLAETYRNKYGNISPGKISGVQNGRQLFRNLKIDPTKYRPSSEALLNRALKNKPLYQVNNIVDIGNWCSLDFLLPICIYDFSKIDPPISFSQGDDNDKYMGINNQIVNLKNKYVFKDHNGAFGSPLKDSIRTSVDLLTNNILAVIVAPKHIENTTLDSFLDIFVTRINQYSSGILQSKMIISS